MFEADNGLQDADDSDHGFKLRRILLKKGRQWKSKVWGNPKLRRMPLKRLADSNRQSATGSTYSEVDAVVDVVLFVEFEPQTCSRRRQ